MRGGAWLYSRMAEEAHLLFHGMQVTVLCWVTWGWLVSVPVCIDLLSCGMKIKKLAINFGGEFRDEH